MARDEHTNRDTLPQGKTLELDRRRRAGLHTTGVYHSAFHSSPQSQPYLYAPRQYRLQMTSSLWRPAQAPRSCPQLQCHAVLASRQSACGSRPVQGIQDAASPACFQSTMMRSTKEVRAQVPNPARIVLCRVRSTVTLNPPTSSHRPNLSKSKTPPMPLGSLEKSGLSMHSASD